MCDCSTGSALLFGLYCSATMARVLILGGVGFVGRNLVQYLVSNNLVSKICVADKVLPEVAGLSESELAIFKGDKVTFKQCNLARDGPCFVVVDPLFFFVCSRTRRILR